MNYRMFAMILGEISLTLGALMCVPLFLAVGLMATGDTLEGIHTITAFAIAVGVALVLGIVGILLRPKKEHRNMRSSSGFAMCAVIWIFIAIISAIPFTVSKAIPSYIDALFETISGYTTTGASILRAVEDLPKSILLWRALTQWVGGMGVLVLLIAVMPKNDKTSTALAKAEIPGPQFGKLVSKLRFTSRILYAIYILLTLVLFGILCAFKMPVFDSFCHAFATASTGGFSVKNASIAAYNSVGIEVTITIFMLLFSFNFNIFYMILIGHFIKAFKNEELFWFIGLFIFGSAIITIDLCANHTFANVGEALRYVSFNVASVMSTTGYGTADFALWPTFSQIVLLALMCVGGCAGSTAGGMKVSRTVILTKSALVDVKRTISPRSIYTVKMDGKAVDNNTTTNIKSFFTLYVLLIVLSTVLISIEPHNFQSGANFETNFSAVISCFNNIGPGIGAVGPCGNYADYSVFAKIVLMLDMLLGRLEIMPMLLLFSFRSWKKA